MARKPKSARNANLVRSVPHSEFIFSIPRTLTMILFRLLALFSFLAGTLASSVICGETEWENHPVLCRMLQWAQDDLQGFADAAHSWAASKNLLVNLSTSTTTSLERNLATRSENQLPVVLAHGMGDSCFNSGMQHVTDHVSKLLGGVYSVCIPTGKTQAEDTKNGYFLNMDASVDVFAQAISEDSELKNGFHAIGFSQGNNVIRGYIAKYNTPAVHTFVSVNGVNAGIGAVPYCQPDELGLGGMCDLLMEEASRTSYTEFAQEHSFQANYWRDPRPSAKELYQTYGQLAVWNNEAGFVNQTLKDNWSKTSAFVWVLATEDGMVWPRLGEHWGAPDPKDPFHHIFPMNETEWYQKDLFGLKTAQEAGKNYFESFVGDHLAFTEEDFERWIMTYLKDQ